MQPLDDKSSTAEDRFRAAFERLKNNKPLIKAPGTSISQNNVAVEAGCDPSALRKTRFPSLIREIAAFVEIQKSKEPSKRQVLKASRQSRADLKQQLKDVAAQRDHAQSQLLAARQRILELTAELAQKSENRLNSVSDISSANNLKLSYAVTDTEQEKRKLPQRAKLELLQSAGPGFEQI